jgi:hypothetical protein
MARITAGNGTVCADCVAAYRHREGQLPALKLYSDEDRRAAKRNRDLWIVDFLKSWQYAPYFLPPSPHNCTGYCDCTGRH